MSCVGRRRKEGRKGLLQLLVLFKQYSKVTGFSPRQTIQTAHQQKVSEQKGQASDLLRRRTHVHSILVGRHTHGHVAGKASEVLMRKLGLASESLTTLRCLVCRQVQNQTLSAKPSWFEIRVVNIQRSAARNSPWRHP